MGCDIHAVMEIKVDGKWYGNTKKIARNYDLFALMAGVRNSDEIEPVAESKGLPDDLSMIARLQYKIWDGDAHNCSWLSLDELRTVAKRCRKASIYSNEIDDVIESCEEYLRFNENVTDVRLVFWFDN